MFGKLTLSAVPHHEPIVIVTLTVVILPGLGVIGAITYYRKWTYLWAKWLTSIDHERIGVMYIAVALVMLVRGFVDAIMMCGQLALAEGTNHGYLPPEHYDQVFTAYGMIIIIFMAIPSVTGLVNLAAPLQIGACDVMSPLLNLLGFWLPMISAMLANVSLGLGEFAHTDQVAYSPLPELAYSPGIGVDCYIWALQVSGMGTLPAGISFLVAVSKVRAPGVRLMQIPIFTWACILANVLVVASLLIFIAALGLLSLSRYLDTRFFTDELGGNAMMYISLFWAWGHPEVYILILLVFGISSEVTATLAGKRMFGYKSMVWASAAITLLGFIMWLHHFLIMGSGGDANGFFGVVTMLVSTPTGVRLFNWLFIIYKSRLRFSTPILWTLGLMVTFTIGGITGVLLVIPGADFLLYDSLFLIAHFHNTIIGDAVFGYLAGFVFWFPKAFGFTLDEKWGKRSFWCWLVGFYMAFMPLYILDFMSMIRRLNHYDSPLWEPYLMVVLFGAVLVFCNITCQLIQLLVPARNRKQLAGVNGDPWEGHTLEWAASSPPPSYNFAELSEVQNVDALHDMKKAGTTYRKLPAHQPIHIPKNITAGFSITVFVFVFDLTVIWHIWQLMVVGFVGMIGSFITCSYNQDVDYYVQSEKIEKTESVRSQQLVKQV